MANPKHLKILNQGVVAWNKWRTENPEIIPDLTDTNLAGKNFSGIDLNTASLMGTRLNGANLSNSYLRKANLMEAELKDVDLSGANLTRAVLTEADLTGANLNGASIGKALLIEADLTETQIRGTDLARANLINAMLVKADLSESNLTGADLRGATLSDSEGSAANLSKAILRGAHFTEIKDSDSWGSYLDLASARGLDSAIFDDPEYISRYLDSAFEFAHRPGIVEKDAFPDFVKATIKRVEFLQNLFSTDQPPSELELVIKQISRELIKYLRKHPDAIYEIKPRRFEELVAEILSSYGWSVLLSPETRDGGYDIFAVSKDISGVRSSWIIECKKYRADRKIGVDIVRNLYGITLVQQGANAMLATTSFFSSEAQNYKASRYNLELRDYNDILEWINNYSPNPNGRLYVKDNRLELG
jgi:uncharacterized protein YjbI with pentapeptide repeats/HJR/Mrr/RecB family endonuclease